MDAAELGRPNSSRATRLPLISGRKTPLRDRVSSRRLREVPGRGNRSNAGNNRRAAICRYYERRSQSDAMRSASAYIPFFISSEAACVVLILAAGNYSITSLLILQFGSMPSFCNCKASCRPAPRHGTCTRGFQGREETQCSITSTCTLAAMYLTRARCKMQVPLSVPICTRNHTVEFLISTPGLVSCPRNAASFLSPVLGPQLPGLHKSLEPRPEVELSRLGKHGPLMPAHSHLLPIIFFSTNSLPFSPRHLAPFSTPASRQWPANAICLSTFEASHAFDHSPHIVYPVSFIPIFPSRPDF